MSTYPHFYNDIYHSQVDIQCGNLSNYMLGNYLQAFQISVKQFLIRKNHSIQPNPSNNPTFLQYIHTNMVYKLLKEVCFPP